jgi:hypothetical protein
MHPQSNIPREIPLTQGRVALVDAADYPALAAHKWRALRNASTWYAVRRAGENLLYMHRVILQAPPHLDVDHTNGDGLDNRRSNIRLATEAQNMTRSKSRAHSSIYKGVSWDARNNKWRVDICIDKKSKNLGRYVSEVEAARAYDRAASRAFGPFARLNF